MGKLLITQFGSLLFLFMYVKLFATDCLVCNTLLGDAGSERHTFVGVDACALWKTRPEKCLRPPLGY